MRQLFIPAEVAKTHCQHFGVIGDILKFLSANDGTCDANKIKLYRSTSGNPNNFPIALSSELCERFQQLAILYKKNCFLSLPADKLPQLIEDINDKVYIGLKTEDVQTIQEILGIVFNYDIICFVSHSFCCDNIYFCASSLDFSNIASHW